MDILYMYGLTEYCRTINWLNHPYISICVTSKAHASCVKPLKRQAAYVRSRSYSASKTGS